MLSEQKMSMKLMIIGAVLLIAAVKGESTGFKLCNHYWGNFSICDLSATSYSNYADRVIAKAINSRRSTTT